MKLGAFLLFGRTKGPDLHRTSPPDSGRWASASPPQNAETAIPQGVPCSRLANLILAPKQEAQRIAAYIPRWGVQLAAHLSDSKGAVIFSSSAMAPVSKTIGMVVVAAFAASTQRR